MKKNLILLMLSVFVYTVSLADGEKIYYKYNGTLYDPATVKLDPCTSATFVVKYTVPQGKDGRCRVEWYDQAYTPYGTTTSDEITITFVPGRVIACTVYYYYGNANPCANVSSMNAPGVNLSFRTIDLSTPSVNPSVIPAGCQNAISFSSAFAGADANHFVPSAGTYSVNWNLPAGWTYNSQSLTTNATPDAGANGGNAYATVTMNSCAYSSSSQAVPISRAFPAPALSISNPSTVCDGTSTARFNLSGTLCGASSYTYIVSGNSGATFSANGQQTLTTTDAFADLSFSGVPNQTALQFWAQANYPGGSSSQVSTSFHYGLPYWVGDITGFDNTVCTSSEQYLSVPIYSGSTSLNYEWTVVSSPFPGSCIFQGGGETGYGQSLDAWFYAEGYYTIQVMAPTECGSAYIYGGVWVENCNFRKATTAPATGKTGTEQLYPNPANEAVNVNLAKILPADNGAKGGSRVKIQLISLNGVVIRTIEGTTGGVTVLDTKSLPVGTYIVRIINGKQLINRKIIIQH